MEQWERNSCWSTVRQWCTDHTGNYTHPLSCPSLIQEIIPHCLSSFWVSFRNLCMSPSPDLSSSPTGAHTGLLISYRSSSFSQLPFCISHRTLHTIVLFLCVVFCILYSNGSLQTSDMIFIDLKSFFFFTFCNKTLNAALTA